MLVLVELAVLLVGVRIGWWLGRSYERVQWEESEMNRTEPWNPFGPDGRF